MTNQERATVVAIVTNVLVNSYAIVRVVQLSASGALAGEDAVMVWARAVVWVIPAAIILTVVLNLLFSMADKDRDQKVVDERDKIFQLRGIVVMVMLICLGYMAMLGILAIGWPTIIALNVLFFTVAFGDFMNNVVKIASYRYGA